MGGGEEEKFAQGFLCLYIWRFVYVLYIATFRTVCGDERGADKELRKIAKGRIRKEGKEERG